MEEKKSRFFDFDVQEQIDNPDKKVENIEPVKTDDTFSKIFGGPKEEAKVEEVKAQTPSTFENVFKTAPIEKKEEVVIAKPSAAKVSFSDIFQGEIIPDKQEERQVKTDDIPTNSSQFFNVKKEVEIDPIQTVEETTDYVEKVGDNPMVDYDRINREAKENAPIEEEKEELPKNEEVLQANRQMASRMNVGGSDLMRLRMQRR